MEKAKSAAEKRRIASSMDKLARIWGLIHAAVVSEGGDLEDIYELDNADNTAGQAAIRAFGKAIAAARRGVEQVAAGYLWRLVENCHFSNVWKDIIEKNFPPPATPVSDKLEYVVFQILEAMTRAEIIAAMDAEGLRPATLYEMLVWAARNPREGTQYWIVTLAEYFADLEGSLSFACIDPVGEGRRELSRGSIYELDDRWSVDGRFLAVRKSSEPLVA